LLILSKSSVESEWVEKEVETAMERERREKRTVLFPIRLDDAVMKIESGWPADIRRSRNIGDFRRWKAHDTYQKSFDRLMRDLQASNAAV
jgi:TIR domain